MPRESDSEQQQPRLRPPPRTHDSEDAVEQRRPDQRDGDDLRTQRNGAVLPEIADVGAQAGDVPATGRTTAAKSGRRPTPPATETAWWAAAARKSRRHPARASPTRTGCSPPARGGSRPQVWQGVEHAEEQSEISRSKNNAFIDSFVSLPGTNCRPDSRKRASANPQTSLLLRSACTLCGGQASRLDRQRLGKSQINLVLPSACTTLRRTSLRLDRRRLGKSANKFAFTLGLHDFAEDEPPLR